MQTLFGRLRWCTDSDRPEFWPWHGEPFYVDPTEAPLELPIEATFDGTRLVDWHRDERLAAEFDDHRKDIALVLVRDSIDESHWDRVRDAALLLQQEYRRYPRGQWDVRVTGYAVVGPVANTIHTVDWAKLRELATAINPFHDHNYWHCWSGYNSQYRGLAWNGGTQAWTAGNAFPDTSVHEQAHNFTLGHAGAEASHSPSYADRRSWQGNRDSRDRHIAPHLYHWGFLEAEEHTEGAARYFLVDSESSPLALHPGECQMVMIERGRSERYAAALAGDKVCVYRPEPAISKRWASTWQLAELSAGQSKEFEQVSVSHVEHFDGASEVVVKWDKSLPDPEHVNFPQAVLPDNAEPVIEGAWEIVEHQGLRLQIVHGKLVGYWYTFDLKNRPRWYEFHGEIRDNIAHLEIFTTRMVGRRRERLQVGHGVLYCTDGENGVLRATTSEHGRVAVRLTRVTTPIEQRIYGFQGVELEGINASRNDTPHGEVNSGFWFRYRDSRQDWLLIDGQDLYRPSHGSFNIPMDSKLEHVGTCEIGERFKATIDGQDHDFGMNRLA